MDSVISLSWRKEEMGSEFSDVAEHVRRGCDR